MRAMYYRDLIAKNSPPYVCDICEEIQNEDGHTEIYWLHGETNEENEQLEKDFPDKETIAICDHCLHRHYPEARVTT